MSTRNRERKNRVIAIIASLALVVGLVPIPALAAPGPSAAPGEPSSAAASAAEAVEETAAPAEEPSQAAAAADEPSGVVAPVEESLEAAAPTEEPSETAVPAEYPVFSQSATADGVTVTVEADEGAFPEGAVLSVASASASETEAAVAPERGAGTNVAASYTFDIKVLDAEGGELQPASGKSVRVSFKAAEVADPNLDVSVYHVSGGAAEELPVSESGSTATAESGGFSYYTVEFTYGDLQYVLPGGSEVALSEVLAAVGLVGEPEAVEVSDPALFSASDESGAWVVTSHQAFSSTEWMRVTIAGQSYEVEVTDAQSGDWYYAINDGEATIHQYGGTAASVEVPSELGGCPVTAIGGTAFANCAFLTSVTIPSSVTTIDMQAFNKCTSLTSVKILETSKLTTIKSNAFSGCASLESVTIPASVISLWWNAFSGCDDLKDVYYNGTEDQWESILKGGTVLWTTGPTTIHFVYYVTVTTSPEDSGTIQGAGRLEYKYPAQLTATPAAGYHFVNWTNCETGAVVSAENPYIIPENEKGNLSLKANFAKDFTMEVNSPQTYSGKAITPVPTVKDAATGSNLAKGDYSVSYQKKDGNPVTEIKDAGDYKVIVKGLNAYEGAEVAKEFTVEQAELTITAKDQSYTYTGYQQGEGDPAYDDPEIIKTKVDAEGLQGDDKITSIVLNGSQTDAGVYEGDSDGIVPSAAAIGVGGALNGNYKIAYVNGTLTIEPAKVTVTTGSASKVYDGKALTNAEASIEGLVKGESATVKATGSQTEVGSSKNTCSIEWGTAKARNYAVTEKLGTLTVEAAPVQEYTVTFENWDGTVLQSGKVAAGEVPVYEGAEPTRPETDQYLYVFDGWTPEVVAATSDATYTAVFEPALRTYDVIWLNDDGTELYRDVHVSYGQMPDYDGPTPTKPSDDKYTYAFSGWKPEVVAVTGDAAYTATYIATPKDKPVYKVVSGAGGSWTEGSGEPMVFKIERVVDPETAFSHFIGIDIDGKAVPEKDASGKANWTARSGSVIVELQPAYLGTLSEGKHTLTALFDDGDPVTAEFKVAAKASPSPDKGTSPKTGDPLAGAFVVAIATAVIALIVMVAFAAKRRRA